MEPGSFDNLMAFASGEEQDPDRGDTFIGQPMDSPEFEVVTFSVTVPRNTRDKTRLTARELEVLAACAQGLSNKLIGVTLGISNHTAKFHMRNALAKLGFTERTGAVAYAIRNGIIK